MPNQSGSVPLGLSELEILVEKVANDSKGSGARYTYGATVSENKVELLLWCDLYGPDCKVAELERDGDKTMCKIFSNHAVKDKLLNRDFGSLVAAMEKCGFCVEVEGN